MPVFDFSDTPDMKKDPECTYTTFRSNESGASAEKPILLLDNQKQRWKHHSCGGFANQSKRTAFEFKEEKETVSADILQIDARFVSLIRWLGENHINVRLSGENRVAMRFTGSVRSPLAAGRSSLRRTVFFSL